MRGALVLLLSAAAFAGGYPKPAGLGRLVVLTNYAGADGRYAAVKRLARHRGAKIVRFREDRIDVARKTLKSVGPEFVAIAATPETVDINFHLRVLDLCRSLDDDPMPDFHFGYLCAADGDDLDRLVDGVLRRESAPPEQPVLKEPATMTGDGGHLQGYDYFLHFGHGTPWGVTGGLSGPQIGELTLPRAPVVWSGACFNGVLSRSYHDSQTQFSYFAPVTIEPERLVALNWVRAGASGLFAALEGDRGEMAKAEWDYFREHACPLGEVIGYQYRLAFTSLPPDVRLPHYRPGVRKNMSFYWVMMRGLLSRLLLSDPSYRPQRKALLERSHRARVRWADGALTIAVTVERLGQGPHVNYLPASKHGVFDRRIYERVELPPGVPAELGDPEVTLSGGLVTRHRVKEEVWGGRRYLNLQVEAPPAAVAKGTVATWIFRP